MVNFSPLSGLLPPELIRDLTREITPEDTAGVSMNPVRVTQNYAAVINDLIEVDTTSNPVTINLPAAVKETGGKKIMIAAAGTAGVSLTNIVTVLPAVGEDVSTYESFVLDVGQATLHLVSNGSGRWLIH